MKNVVVKFTIKYPDVEFPGIVYHLFKVSNDTVLEAEIVGTLHQIASDSSRVVSVVAEEVG